MKKLFFALIIFTLLIPSANAKTIQVDAPVTDSPGLARIISWGVDGPANNNSLGGTLSDDGQRVAFDSWANNLIQSWADDTNNTVDVYFRDMFTNTAIISSGENEIMGNNASNNAHISGDGISIVYQSLASDLLSGEVDSNGAWDIFLYSFSSGIQRVSVSSAGTEANGNSTNPGVSSNGRFVVYQSEADNLVSGDTNNSVDIFVRNTLLKLTYRVSISSAGEQANLISLNPAISDDGRVIAFWSAATNLVGGDDNNQCDLFVHDGVSLQTTRIDSSGVEDCTENFLGTPSLSADGNQVTYHAYGNTNGSKTAQAYVYIRSTGERRMISVGYDGLPAEKSALDPVISANGRYVAYDSSAANLVPNDTNATSDVFFHDLETGETRRVSVSSNRQQANKASFVSDLSAAGRFITFQSAATNLVPTDTNGKIDVFRHERLRPFTTIARCVGVGEANPLITIADQGIRFTANQDFHAVELRLATDQVGTYTFKANLHRSNGFTVEPEVTIPIELSNLPIYWNRDILMPVRIDFEEINVTGNETFTLGFSDFSGPGNVFIESSSRNFCGFARIVDAVGTNPPGYRDPSGFRLLQERPDGGLLISPGMKSTLVIDGKRSPGEWQATSANRLDFEQGSLSVMDDGLRLYLLLNLLDDPGDDSLAAGDQFEISVDLNQDGALTPYVDINYRIRPSDQQLVWERYTAPGTFSEEQEALSSYARGFDCYFDDGTQEILTGAGGIINTCLPHRVWEIALDLEEMGAKPADIVRIGFKVNSALPESTHEIPIDFQYVFSNLIEIALSPAEALIHPPDPAAVIQFDTYPLEITQAIQTITNTLPLVEGKPTFARVYLHHAGDGVANQQPVKVYLYGRKYENSAWINLPGSPLSLLHYAPETIDRDTIDHTANFVLPETWLSGDVTFTAIARDLFGRQFFGIPDKAFRFEERDIPKVHMIVVNTGTEAAPKIISNTSPNEWNRQLNAMQAIFPVKKVNFSYTDDWTVLGTTTITDTIPTLNRFYDLLVQAWARSYTMWGPGIDLPDQIHGLMAQEYGGMSDPKWGSGAGRGIVSYGGPSGSSRELVMAHEINHNLDSSATGTWGRHTPEAVSCGAKGPDPNWPYPDDDIQQTGITNQEPWITDPAQLIATPHTRSDLMSYCNPGVSPAKWISPYRWNALFDYFAPKTNLAPESTAIQDVIYVSGYVNKNGTGNLDPLLFQPGLLSQNIIPGEYSLEVQNSAGEVLHSTPFRVSFLTADQDELSEVFFSFSLPFYPEARRVLLKQDTTVLAIRQASAHAPSIAWVYPAGGETLRGITTLSWTAQDLDGDNLQFEILYSPDGGQKWHPVATHIKTSSHTVNTANLPGGNQGQFLLIASDGFHNTEAVTPATFTITPKAPEVAILSPQQGESLPPARTFRVEGCGYDPEDGDLPDQAFLWELDGVKIATGRQVDLTLPFGVFTLRLTAYDSQGYSTQVEMKLPVGWYTYLPLTRR
jgi:hypothetical protein